MSTAVVQPTRADLIDAAATLEALLELIWLEDADVGAIVQRWPDEIRGRLLGCPADDDEQWHSDPTVVEVGARAAEIEAEILESIAREKAEWEIHFGRAATLRAMAPRYREQGTIDIPFRLREEPETQ